MSEVKPNGYYILFTLDGEVKEEIAATNPFVIHDVLKSRERDTVYLEIYDCDLVNESEELKHKHQFSMDDLLIMNSNHIKNLVKNLMTYDEMETMKSWF